MWFQGSTFFIKLKMYIIISGIAIKIIQRDIAKKTIAKLKWSLKIFN